VIWHVPAGDVAPVMPTRLARLKSRHLTWRDGRSSQLTPRVHQSRQSRRHDLSHSSLIGVTSVNLNWHTVSLPFLSFHSFSLLPLSLSCDRRSAAATNFTTAVGARSVADPSQSWSLAFPEGTSSLLTKYILF
jgi:hypothetical protein